MKAIKKNGNFIIIFIDEVMNFHPLALENGGFLYKMDLRAPLQVPIKLLLVYTEVGSGNKMNFSSQYYFASENITHIADKKRVPFDKFRVKIALTYYELGLVGPFLEQDNEYCEFQYEIIICTLLFAEVARSLQNPAVMK